MGSQSRTHSMWFIRETQMPDITQRSFSAVWSNNLFLTFIAKKHLTTDKMPSIRCFSYNRYFRSFIKCAPYWRPSRKALSPNIFILIIIQLKFEKKNRKRKKSPYKLHSCIGFADTAGITARKVPGATHRGLTAIRFSAIRHRG